MKPSLLKSIFVYLLLMLCFAFNIHAQQAALLTTVTGSLTNEQAKPVDYATVSLINGKDSSIVKGALSNDAGLYRFEHIKPGTYMIKATSIGYAKAVSQSFTVSPGMAKFVVPAIKMHTGGHNLQAVNIVAVKPLIERKIDRTVMNVENSVLAAGNSAMEILEKAPGVTIDKDDNISLKGKQGVTVMINDKLTYLSATQLATLLRSTDGNTIQSIEIITNPSAKYDAAGTSGIINIKLKKNKQTGTNGSVTVGAGYSKYWKDNMSINLNHKEGSLNVFGTFSRGDNQRYHDINIDRVTKDSLGRPTYFTQYTHMPQTNHYNNYNLGADYDLSSKNTIGFVVSGYSNTETDKNDDRTSIGSGPGIVDSTLHTVSTIGQTYKNFALNLNDRYKIDTSGQELSIDLDYSKFNNNSNALYNTDYFLPNGSIQHSPMVLTNLTPSTITIYTAKADYTKPLSKTIKLETGIKISSIKTDNDLQAQILSNGVFVNDTTRTNRFIYDEKIGAGYVNLNKQFKKTSLQLGLRAEYTQSEGDLIGSAPVNRSYLDFFPSAFINRTLNDKNEINLSYSRRIDRPSYGDLNPFVYYLDPYTFSQGNAFLNPQYTNNFEFNYTYNKSINVSLGYSRTTDAITELILTVGNKSFDTHRNLQVQTSYNINVNSPYTITKWWTGNVNFNGFYLGFKSDTLAGGTLNNGQYAFQVKTTQTLLFGKFKGEIMGDYQSSLTYGIFEIKPRYGVDAGVSRSFAEKKFNVKLSLSDIFNTRTNDLTSHVLNNDIIVNQKNDTRVLRLNLTYNFGSTKFQTREHRSGADDEKNRVKGN